MSKSIDNMHGSKSILKKFKLPKYQPFVKLKRIDFKMNKCRSKGNKQKILNKDVASLERMLKNYQPYVKLTRLDLQKHQTKIFGAKNEFKQKIPNKNVTSEKFMLPKYNPSVVLKRLELPSMKHIDKDNISTEDSTNKVMFQKLKQVKVHERTYFKSTTLHGSNDSIKLKLENRNPFLFWKKPSGNVHNKGDLIQSQVTTSKFGKGNPTLSWKKSSGNIHNKKDLMQSEGLCAKCTQQKNKFKMNEKENALFSDKNQYHCSMCGKSFLQKMSLRVHERIHLEQKAVKCTSCENFFFCSIVKNFQDKMKHLNNAQQVKKSHFSMKENHINCKFNIKYMRISLNHFLKSVRLKTELIKDKKIHSRLKPYRCFKCEESYEKKAYLRIHSEIHRKKYNCLYCEKSCRRKHSLVVHERTHTGKNPFICVHCEKSFERKCSLIGHERTHEKFWHCSYCEKTFAKKYTLACHERTHTGEKPFCCSYCEKTFAKKYSLDCHERTHTGEKPFCCSYCDKSFAQKHNLARHEQRIHIG